MSTQLRTRTLHKIVWEIQSFDSEQQLPYNDLREVLSLVSGFGTDTSSGAFSVRTAEGGSTGGVSGSLSFTTGTTKKGSSGTVVLRTGMALRHQSRAHA